MLLCFFFFSSRRRHTRYIGDWSSDVCSSDLDLALMIVDGDDESPQQYSANGDSFTGMKAMRGPAFARLQYANNSGHVVMVRSEERRVGKECRSRWWREPEKKETQMCSVADLD